MAVLSATESVKQAQAPIPLFELSSQYRNWRYSAAGLAQMRNDLNAAAVQRVKTLVDEEKTTGAVTDKPASNDIAYLSVQDELALVGFYFTKTSQLCKAFKFPPVVEATAISYMKRFYLRNTCMDYHPKSIMLTCVFLASKTENCLVTIDSFTSKIPKCTPDDVLNLEFLVSQSLKFQFKVHHAHLALHGIWLDMLQCGLVKAEDDSIYTTALSHISTSRLTDAEFLYTPSQVAAACMQIASPDLTKSWVQSKLPQALAEDAHAKQLSDMQDSLRTLVETLQNFQKVDVEAVREIDRRLHFCKNPEKDPDSALHKKRKAEAEAVEAVKRAKKAESQSNDDPFA